MRHSCNSLHALGQDNTTHDLFFVFGPDRSPAGMTWKELYDRAPPARLPPLEVTEFMKAAEGPPA